MGEVVTRKVTRSQTQKAFAVLQFSVSTMHWNTAIVQSQAKYGSEGSLLDSVYLSHSISTVTSTEDHYARKLAKDQSVRCITIN